MHYLYTVQKIILEPALKLNNFGLFFKFLEIEINKYYSLILIIMRPILKRN